MRYTKTALMELTKRYSNVLKKCALINAAILMGTMIALPANATYTYKMPEVAPFSEQSSITTQITDNTNGYNLFTGMGIRNTVTGNVNLSIKGTSENPISIPSEGAWNFSKPTGVIGNLYFPKSQRGNWTGSETGETACSSYVAGNLNMELENVDISGMVYGSYNYLDTSFYNSTSDEQPNLTTGVKGTTTITVKDSSISGTIYAAAVPSAGAEPSSADDKRIYAEYLKTHAPIGDVVVNIDNSSVGEVTPVGAFLTAKSVAINVKGNSQITDSSGDGIIAGISRIAGRVTGDTLINLDTDGVDNTIDIASNVHVGSREHTDAIKNSDPDSVIGNATLNMLGGGTINVDGDLRAYHVKGTTALNINNVTANVASIGGTEEGEFDTITLGEDAQLNLTGTLTMNEGSTLKVADLSNGTVISGGTINANGATLDSTSFVVSNEGEYTFADSNFGRDFVLSDNLQTAIANNLLYTINYDTGTFTAESKDTEEIVEDLVENGASQQQADTMVAVVDAAGEGGTETGAQVAEAIAEALQEGDVETAGKAADALAPTDAKQVMGIAQGVNTLLTKVADGRIAQLGKSGGDTFKGGSTWIQGLYNYAKQDSSGSTAGFKADTVGVAMGADGKIDDATTVGIGYGYAKTDADSAGRDVDVDGHNFFVYGSYQPSAWYVNGMLGYGLHKYTEKKSPDGVAMKGKYDVNTYSANVMTGYDLDNGITPEGGFRYILADQGSYNDGAQRISTKNDDVLTAVMGVKYSKDFKVDQWTLKPTARLAMTYDIISDDTTANVNVIGGGNYQITGKRLNRFGIETGIGLTGTLNNWDFTVEYAGGFRKDFQNHTGMLRAKYHF